MSDASAAFWDRFCSTCGVDPAARHDVFAFGDTPRLQDELVALVVDGPKRATAGLVAEFAHDRSPLPVVGGYGIVLDGAGRPRCVIRTVQVDIAAFRDVDAGFAWDEGEGDRSLADWRRAHESCFSRACARLGLAFGEDLPVVLERFELVWRPPET